MNDIRLLRERKREKERERERVREKSNLSTTNVMANDRKLFRLISKKKKRKNVYNISGLNSLVLQDPSVGADTDKIALNVTEDCRLSAEGEHGVGDVGDGVVQRGSHLGPRAGFETEEVASAEHYT